MLRKMLSISALGLLAASAVGLTGCAYHDHDHHHDRKLYRYERHHPERHYHGRHYHERHHHHGRHHHHDDHWHH